MKILISEHKLASLIQYQLNEFITHTKNNSDVNAIANNSLSSFLIYNNKVAINTENNKEYLICELPSLLNAIGKKFCVCQLIKDNELYGPFYVKPLNIFKIKTY